MTKELDTWAGEFGDEYTERNMPTEQTINHRKMFWAGVLSTLPDPPKELNSAPSILEVGANVGANLVAIDAIYQNTPINLYAVEPNIKARKILKNQDIKSLKIVEGNACEIQLPNASVDLAFTCGVLIHIHPNNLQKAIGEIHRVSRRFIICAEYFSPEPREMTYRGEKGLLWTRDFGLEYLNSTLGLRCISYSFAWKPFTGMDNLTWFIFEKVH